MFKHYLGKLLTQRVDLYQKEIQFRNLRGYRAFVKVGFVISLLIFALGLLVSDIVPTSMVLYFSPIYFLILYLVTKIPKSKPEKHITLLFYMAMTPLMAGGIWLGSFLKPNAPAVIILIFICVLPMFILDKPWRIAAYITAVSAVYVVCCFFAKDLNIFATDMIDLVACYFVSLGVHFFTLNDRLDSVENYIKLRDKSEIDALTEVYNRSTGVEKIQKCLDQTKGGFFALTDIDNFKYINDNFGHTTGDEALQEIIRVVRKSVPNESIILRMGGDEFGIYLQKQEDTAVYRAVMDKLFYNIKKENDAADREYHLSFSAGCIVIDEQIADFKKLYKMSDAVLYLAKENGRSQYVIKS